MKHDIVYIQFAGFLYTNVSYHCEGVIECLIRRHLYAVIAVSA